MNTHQTPTARYLIEVPGGLGGGEVEARSLTAAVQAFTKSLPEGARANGVRVLRRGVGVTTVTTSGGAYDVRFTRLS